MIRKSTGNGGSEDPPGQGSSGHAAEDADGKFQKWSERGNYFSCLGLGCLPWIAILLAAGLIIAYLRGR